jgi:putative ABC transport system permease protein
MQILREWLHRLGATIRADRRDEDLAEELRLHTEFAAERGRRVTGAAQAMDALRDQRGVPIVSGLGHDVRLAVRSLRATPVVTTVAIASLALAIGANTAIFSILNSLLLRTLPVQVPARLVHVTDNILLDTGDTRVRAWSYPAWEQIRQRAHLFEAATAWSGTRFDLAIGGETRFIDGLWADGGFFETLGVPAALGRAFSHRDDQRGGGPDGLVAVISHGYWQRQFAGAASVIGQPLRLNGVPFTIVGVTPPDFFGMEVGRVFDVVVPLQSEALLRGQDSVLDEAAANFLSIIARLRPEQSLEAAAVALRSVQSEIRAATAGPWEKGVLDRYLTAPFTVLPASTGFSYLREGYQRPLLVLAVVVALVLLVGCVNVANLLLARAVARAHEVSVQVALGASRWRLVRQMLVESIVLSGAAAGLGVLIAASGSRFLVRQLSTPTNAVFLDLSVDGRVLGFTVAVAAVTALLFGTAPAFRAARVTPIDALKDRARGSAEHRGGLMGWLIPVQVALALILIVAAGLFIRSFTSLAGRELGFQPDPVLVGAVGAERTMIDPTARVPLYERVRAAVVQLPDVADASISFATPGGGGGYTPAIEVSTAGDSIRVAANGDVFGNLISPGYFATYGTRLVAGRDVTDQDRRGASGVAIVNETFARRFLGSVSPLGQTFTVYPNTPRALPAQIVGVAADAVYASPRDPVPAAWYIPLAQMTGFPLDSIRLSVRARSGSPALLRTTVAAAIATVDPRLALSIRPLRDQLDATLTRERLMAQLAGFFGALALLLAGLGLYGVTAFSIARRRTEIGIRLALGATPRRVIRMVLARVSVLVAAGVVAGTLVSLWASRFVEGLIYNLPPRDPATLAGALLVLSAIAALAGWLPARRAACANPVAALRDS